MTQQKVLNTARPSVIFRKFNPRIYRASHFPARSKQRKLHIRGLFCWLVYKPKIDVDYIGNMTIAECYERIRVNAILGPTGTQEITVR